MPKARSSAEDRAGTRSARCGDLVLLERQTQRRFIGSFGSCRVGCVLGGARQRQQGARVARTPGEALLEMLLRLSRFPELGSHQSEAVVRIRQRIRILRA